VVDTGSTTVTPLTATVSRITTAAQAGGGSPTADFKVSWPDGTDPKFGVPVQVNITVKEKPAALIVPKKALRQTGSRTYVEVLDGTLRRITNVEVGITTNDTVEIVSGLTEGQVVALAS